MDPNPSLILEMELERAATCNSFEILPTNKSEEEDATNEVTQAPRQMQARATSRPGNIQTQDFIVKPKRVMANAGHRKRTNSLLRPSPDSLVVVNTIRRLLPLALVLIISQLDLIRPVSGGGGGHIGPNRTQAAPAIRLIAKRADDHELAEELASEEPTLEEDSRLGFKEDRAGLLPHDGHLSSAPPKQTPGQQKLHIVRLLAPDSVQNGTQNVTIDCMFKHDKKLDQRLAIKWYFNDEVEPIYQWIPELNKRVYSDKYERFIDKQYQVSEDVDFMLQAYKQLTGALQSQQQQADQEAGLTLENSIGSLTDGAPQIRLSSSSSIAHDEQAAIASRKLLANRLNRLAKLGSDHSRQLLRSLRTMLAMDQEELSRFRALRLIRPTVEMGGRYTCSISSLDGDDLQSTRLIVYEPPKSFTFDVSKTAGQMYNLTCQAGPTYPRPTLALYRYRAGQLDQASSETETTQTAPSNQQLQLQSLKAGRRAHRPKLAATTLRQEPLASMQTQLKISAVKRAPDAQAGAMIGPNLSKGDGLSNDILTSASSSGLELREEEAENSVQPLQASPYEISAWALVDEASLSNNLVTQFECVLTIEGANYEQRQSLALQKGWHVNASTLMARSTLVGLMSVLASLLCLIVALVSAILIFKLLRRHANKSTRIHQQVGGRTLTTATVATMKRRSSSEGGGKYETRGQTNGACEVNSASSTPSHGSSSTTTATSEAAPVDDDEFRSNCSSGTNSNSKMHFKLASSASRMPPPPQPSSRQVPQAYTQQQHQRHQMNYSSEHNPSNMAPTATKNDQSDGIYRVPEQSHLRSSFGTRYVIGGDLVQQQPQVWSTSAAATGPLNQIYIQRANGRNQTHGYYAADDQQQHSRPQVQIAGMPTEQQHRPHQTPATISVNGKQLYC